jgi:hypothetical protein
MDKRIKIDTYDGKRREKREEKNKNKRREIAPPRAIT